MLRLVDRGDDRRKRLFWIGQQSDAISGCRAELGRPSGEICQPLLQTIDLRIHFPRVAGTASTPFARAAQSPPRLLPAPDAVHAEQQKQQRTDVR